MKSETGLRDVSIVIVTYKGDDVLERCLASLRETCGGEAQVVVVDNSPAEDGEENTTARLVAEHPRAIYVASPGNLGFAGGNNLAMPYCTGRWVLLLNNDTIVHSRRSIEDMVEFLERHPECGVVQGSIVLPRFGERIAGGCGSFLTPFGFQYARAFGVPLDRPGLEKPTRCFSVMGAFMMFPRFLAGEQCNGGVGFLFYDHFRSYYEESDFCHRVWLAGYEVWYLPTKPIEHLCGYTSNKFDRTEIMRQYIRNSFYSLGVNLGFWGRVTIIPLYAVVMSVHALVHLLRGNVKVFNSDISIFSELLTLRGEISRDRRRIIRKITDATLFRRVIRIPPLSYFVSAVKSNI